ncbi:MAG: D-tyrosyl-tRNA(Tyr) deacylase [Chloroflexi bacterium]|nr:MAG: D-tyrosyl-tRNA(Tyr) deacylase [Chloroflexota bacterium]HDN79563.1 D-tyrosyl-tRNA(Tyr) deacylase [Chloroflexota bacterium]
MRAVVQRVKKASVKVDGKEVGAIGKGFVVLIAVKRGDTEEYARWMAHKIANLRVFPDERGKFNFSLLDVGGEALVVSQFTLYGDIRRGFRPSFTEAAPPQEAEPLIEKFVEYLKEKGVPVQTGVFGAMMLVEIFNDGPVTIILEKG